MTVIKRMTHEQTKAQTRTRLIAAGREHFLRYGFSKSTAENITKRAGYTRGALYSNFGDKEGLFLAVIRDIRTQSLKAFGQLADEKSGEELFEAIRLANVDLFSKPEYRLRLEFELECLRNKTLRESYREVDEEILKYACNLLDKIRATSDIHFVMGSRDFILSIQSLGCGLAMKQLLVQPSMSHEDVRRIMLSFFDLAVFRAKRTPKGQAAS
jgi:AcrR family transcriptional regulator